MAETDRVERFKREIGFERVTARGEGRGDVVFEWPDLESGAGLRDTAGWRRVQDFTTSDAPGEAYRVRTLQNDTGTFTVAIHVSSSGAGTARERLVELAGRTMTVDIPYVAAPAGLGDLAVVHRNPLVPDLIWVYANVCIRVDADESHVDPLAFARDLQAQMEKHVEPGASRALQITRLAVEPGRVSEGQEVRVTVQANAPRPDSVLFKVKDTENLLSKVDENVNVFRFLAKAPGTARLRAVAIDRRTLLSASSSADVEIVPAPEPRTKE